MRQTSALLGVTASALVLVGAVFVGTPTGSAPTVVAAKPAARNAGGVVRGFNPNPRICATPELKAADVELIERFVDAEYRKIRRPPAVFGPIQVAFHCVYYDDSFFQIGLLTQSEIQAQIDALNVAYAATGITFNLASTSFTNNPDWFLHSPGGNDERNMKLALGADTSEFLNIYSTGLSFVGLLGYATFPWNLRGSPELDGVVISYDSLPGGLAPYDEGDTLVHEVGHWCGLFHTFQGGCSKRNDGVADTPAELDPFFGCTTVQPDTCPAPGLDPIFNFMDYSDDACLVEFTAGQTTRMTKMLTIFRSALQ